VAYVPGDWISFTGASTTQGPFTLLGGLYGVGVSATFGGGSVTLQTLMPDGSTYVTCLAPFTAAGTALVNLPPGTYQVAIATATAVQCFVVRTPYRAA
jgi:hypothetical protein